MNNQKKYSLLYVDDEEHNLLVFKSTFRKYYKVYTASSAKDGLAILAEKPIHLVVSDQRMPDTTGVQFLKEVKSTYPHTERIILTAFSDINAIIDGVNACGISRYLVKPWEKEETQFALDQALEHYQLRADNRSLIDKLQNTNEALEQKVQHRTEELQTQNETLEQTNQELKNSEDKLSKLNEVKDKLISIISHDLRAPLHTLSNFMSTFIAYQDAFTKEDTIRLSKEIKLSVHNVSDLLDNLLTWSRAQMGHAKKHIESIDIQGVIETNVRLFTPTAAEKGIKLQAQNLSEFFVKVDKGMLDFVIRNLINNAIKFSNKDDSITIAVVSDGQYATVSIQDTGVGISSDVLPHLFDDKKQYTTAGTSKEKGTGLGLILCKNFVNELGGEISVNSQEGEGSTFSFTVPLA